MSCAVGEIYVHIHVASCAVRRMKSWHYVGLVEEHTILMSFHCLLLQNLRSDSHNPSLSSELAFRPSFLLHELVPLASSLDKLDAAITMAKRLAPGSEDVLVTSKSRGGGRKSSDWLTCSPHASRSVLAGAAHIDEAVDSLRRRLYSVHLDIMNMFIPEIPYSYHVGMMNMT